eukprot:CAMPEP_0119305362 /NCGR_PEP_ID=MMETSP1333-20130426/6374_1 /TAXON_ID=418940 /ORGANISM="Scyphosphaera apsteinii, Strain RCC1455" /LENGTH=97 /DNA_ID=CAMNT_0007308435 /DNA_START=159 /DNA_END=450 /DNA_ORIENTATION=-
MSQPACRVVVHDDDYNTADEVLLVLRHLGMSAIEAGRTVQRIMEHGSAEVMTHHDVNTCNDAVASLIRFGLSARVEQDGEDGEEDNYVDDLIHVLYY